MNLKEIKDAARQAFSDQQSQDTEGGVPDAVSFIAGFIAGARHVQNAYETLQAHDEMLIATVDKLKEENKKLREAIKLIDSSNDDMAYYNSDINNIIIQVLKEVGEE